MITEGGGGEGGSTGRWVSEMVRLALVDTARGLESGYSPIRGILITRTDQRRRIGRRGF